MQSPWIDKYRPIMLNDIVGHSEVIQTLRSFIKNDCIPHMIFTGPAGTGKTSTARAFGNDVINKFKVNSLFASSLMLFRNASDLSRISDVDEIKSYIYNNTNASLTKNYYRFIILDESDKMESDAQTKYRRIIEKVPPNVKFIFICNFAEKLIDPILSRCAIFRFPPLSREYVVSQLKNIVEKEGIIIKESILDIIYDATSGDMRSAINAIQTITIMADDTITERNICDFFGILTDENFKTYRNGIMHSRFDLVFQALHSIPEIYPRNFLIQLYKELSKSIENIDLKKNIIKKIAETDYQITEIADEKFQIEGMSGNLCKLIGEMTPKDA